MSLERCISALLPLHPVRYFVSTAGGTYNVPSETTRIKVWLIGGGGGVAGIKPKGGGDTGSGGAGGMAHGDLVVVGGETITWGIGGGGAAGPSTPGTTGGGSAGGQSTLTVTGVTGTLRANGGGVGTWNGGGGAGGAFTVFPAAGNVLFSDGINGNNGGNGTDGGAICLLGTTTNPNVAGLTLLQAWGFPEAITGAGNNPNSYGRGGNGYPGATNGILGGGGGAIQTHGVATVGKRGGSGFVVIELVA